MNRFRKVFTNFLLHLHEEGITFTLKHYLNYLHLKNYMSIKYPVGNIEVKVRTNTTWRLLERGEYEIESLKFVYDKIKAKQTIIDVGGYMGAYTLLFSKLIGEKGCVHTFEPDPRAFPILIDNLTSNNISNVYPQKIALSDSPGETKLISRNVFGHSGSSIVDIKDGSRYQEIMVPKTTLDLYCRKYELNPSFIKVDIEGGEKIMLKGAEKTLKNNSLILLLEFHSKYMLLEERDNLWEKLIKYSKEALYIEGNSVKYKYGDIITKLPEESVFRAAFVT